uniref:Ankyrin repeat-containing protein n=1 Tax=Parastrongyloides trichosuri TaxID=131310 RepID=A0A0N4ZX16_PARTI
MNPESLQTIAKRSILCQMYNEKNLHRLKVLPIHIVKHLKQLKTDIDIFYRVHINFIDVFTMSLVSIDPLTGLFDRLGTIKNLRRYSQPAVYFQLCAVNAMDDETLEVWLFGLTELEHHALLISDNEVVAGRALEIVGREGIINYEHCAMKSAYHGWLPALERSLMRVQDPGSGLLSRCILMAIRHHHYHIANLLECDEFSESFVYFFPNGFVPVDFVISLLDGSLINIDIGRTIAKDLIDWMPKMEIQKLREGLKKASCCPFIMSELETMYTKRIEPTYMNDGDNE